VAVRTQKTKVPRLVVVVVAVDVVDLEKQGRAEPGAVGTARGARVGAPDLEKGAAEQSWLLAARPRWEPNEDLIRGEPPRSAPFG
jgi:hypothetical protein